MIVAIMSSSQWQSYYPVHKAKPNNMVPVVPIVPSPLKSSYVSSPIVSNENIVIDDSNNIRVTILVITLSLLSNMISLNPSLYFLGFSDLDNVLDVQSNCTMDEGKGARDIIMKGDSFIHVCVCMCMCMCIYYLSSSFLWINSLMILFHCYSFRQIYEKTKRNKQPQ